jgi:hypothetical protein
MNNYPSWWNTTVTIYNKYVEPETKAVSWFRTVLEGCFYSHEVEKLNLGQTTISSNVSICRIRVNDSFLNKRAWNELLESEKHNHFTLSAGDIIVAEAVDDEINEYEKGNRSSDLIAKYKEWPGCFVVETAKINVGGGRGNEHYHARGNG